MRPRGKLQLEVEGLRYSLPAIKPDLLDWAMTREGVAYAGSESVWCSVCGKMWVDKTINGKDNKILRCPHCQVSLRVQTNGKKKIGTAKYYVTIVQRKERWQVLRHFYVVRRVHREDYVNYPHKEDWSCWEVMQDWVSREGSVFLRRSVCGMSYYYDQWNNSSDLSYFPLNDQRRGLWSYIAPKQDLLPEVRRNGLSKLRSTISPVKQVESMLRNPKCEILAKHKSWKLWAWACRMEIAPHQWAAIRIALRHKHKISDISLWLDYVDELHDNGKDIHNPYYIFSKEGLKKHIQGLNEKSDKQGSLMREAKVYNHNLRLRLGKAVTVRLTEGDITIAPLRSVQEFYREGQELSHCVYRNRYYRKTDIVILGAKVQGVRTETLEVSTGDWSILQCRGEHNQPSKWHNKIMELYTEKREKLIRAYGKTQ